MPTNTASRNVEGRSLKKVKECVMMSWNAVIQATLVASILIVPHDLSGQDNLLTDFLQLKNPNPDNLVVRILAEPRCSDLNMIGYRRSIGTIFQRNLITPEFGRPLHNELFLSVSIRCIRAGLLQVPLMVDVRFARTAPVEPTSYSLPYVEVQFAPGYSTFQSVDTRTSTLTYAMRSALDDTISRALSDYIESNFSRQDE